MEGACPTHQCKRIIFDAMSARLRTIYSFAGRTVKASFQQELSKTLAHLAPEPADLQDRPARPPGPVPLRAPRRSRPSPASAYPPRLPHVPLRVVLPWARRSAWAATRRGGEGGGGPVRRASEVRGEGRRLEDDDPCVSELLEFRIFHHA